MVIWHINRSFWPRNWRKENHAKFGWDLETKNRSQKISKHWISFQPNRQGRFQSVAWVNFNSTILHYCSYKTDSNIDKVANRPNSQEQSMDHFLHHLKNWRISYKKWTDNFLFRKLKVSCWKLLRLLLKQHWENNKFWIIIYLFSKHLNLNQLIDNVRFISGKNFIYLNDRAESRVSELRHWWTAAQELRQRFRKQKSSSLNRVFK